MASVPFDFQLESSTPKKVEPAPKPEPVMEPHEHDVLCGRGGLTNHHPGNAWYRRLVRSNRPLYRSSPKHTKLLVAKAIVHHVQSQKPSGRFLECQRNSGLWFPVSYKRAVDKTSQALRERDREGEGMPETKPMTLKDVPAPSKELAQTALSTGQVGNSSTVQQATVKKENEAVPPAPPALQQTASWFWQNNKKQKTEAAAGQDEPLPLPTAPLTERASSIFRFFSTSKLMGTDGNNAAHSTTTSTTNQPEVASSNNFDDPLMNPFPSPQRNKKKLQKIKNTVNNPDIPAGMSLEPPQGMTLEPPQASAPFAVAQGLEPLPAAPATVGTNMGASQMSGNGSINMGGGSNGVSMGGSTSSMGGANSSLDPLPLHTGGNNSSAKQRKRSRESFENPPMPSSRGMLGDGASMPGDHDAPSLTRLTTQMSDWLQSFWPLGDERGRQQQQQQMQQHMQQQQMQQQQDQQQMQYQQQRNNNHNSGGNNNMNGGPMLNNMSTNNLSTNTEQQLRQQLMEMSTRYAALQNEIAMHNNNNNNSNSNGNSNSNVNGSGNLNNNGISNSNGNSNSNIASADISAQVQQHMQQLQAMRNTVVSSAMNNNNNAPPAPTGGLTASVSSTFLQLATSPSRLFSGLSTFFTENGQKSHGISQVGGEMMMGVGGTNTSAMNPMAMGGANTSAMNPMAMGGGGANTSAMNPMAMGANTSAMNHMTAGAGMINGGMNSNNMGGMNPMSRNNSSGSAMNANNMVDMSRSNSSGSAMNPNMVGAGMIQNNNGMGGGGMVMNGGISTPMMEANNSAGLMPAPMIMGAVSIGNGGLNTGFHGEFSVSGANTNTNAGGGTEQQRPTFGRRSSGRSLLDDDDD